MRFWIVNSELPWHDRTSGGLRLFTLIELLCEAGHHCEYVLSTPEAERQRLGARDYARYCGDLAALGVSLLEGIPSRISGVAPDAVIFEWFIVARELLPRLRWLCPHARLIVDSVDLTYQRWHAKADLSGLPEDRAHADRVETEELDTYAAADLVLTLTDEDARELDRRLPGLPSFNIPNIHTLPGTRREETTPPSVLFIGSFSHQPNVDAVRWFHGSIWPSIRQRVPDVKWIIIGGDAPPDILAMADAQVTVAGRVPSTAPYLTSAWVSIAPLRFGAGMKGKVGEALAAEIPVVTTPFGIQGYGLVDGESVMVATDAAGFADQVVRLLGDRSLRLRLAAAGLAVVGSHFSRQAISRRIPALVSAVATAPLRQRTRFSRLACWRRDARDWWSRHVGWRFR
jgi:glycosyltransferase involved in cell wall biosynthesis